MRRVITEERDGWGRMGKGKGRDGSGQVGEGNRKGRKETGRKGKW